MLRLLVLIALFSQLALGNSIFEAAKHHDLASIKQILSQDSTLVNQHDDKGNTALHYAAESADPDIIDYLTSHSAQVDAVNKLGETPIAKGLEVQNLQDSDSSDSNDSSAFRQAHAEEERSEAISLLIVCGANVSWKNDSGMTLLHLASLHGHTGAAELLISRGVNTRAKTLNGDTPLHFAKLASTVYLLLEQGVNINARDNNGQTPLILATKQNSLEVVSALLESGADRIAKDNTNHNALDYASTNEMRKLLEQSR